MEKFTSNVIGDIKSEVKFLLGELLNVLHTIKAQTTTVDKIEQFIKEIIVLILSKVSEKLTQVKSIERY
jgi:hypothetical protein